MPDRYPTIERWTDLIPAFHTLVDEVGDWPCEVLVLGRRFREEKVRSRTPLPIGQVASDDESGEIVVRVPGLLRGNPIGREALTFRSLLEAVESLAPDRQFFKLVLSDDLPRSELPALLEQARRSGSLPDGLGEMDLDEWRVRFDMPPRSLGLALRRRRRAVRFDVEP